MNILFSNNTTVRAENNLTDLDIMQQNNQLGRDKKKLRYTVTMAIAIPLFVIVYFGFIPRLLHNYGILLGVFAVSVIIGYFPAEMAVKAKYGNGTGTGTVMTPPKKSTYHFTEDKIMMTQDFETMDIPYNAIERVTQNPYFFYIYYMGYKYQLDKNGFSGSSKDFENLMTSLGKSIGIEYNN